MSATREMKEQARDTAPLGKRQASLDGADAKRQADNSPESIRFLQRYLGNSYLQSVARGRQTLGQAGVGGGAPAIQPKLTIGSVNDVYEQEADRVAEQVMRMPEPGIQRKPT